MIDRISNDIALLIIDYLCPTDLLCTEQTCERFRSLVARNDIWQPLYARLFPLSSLGLQHCQTWKHVYLYKAGLQHAWKKGSVQCILAQDAHTDAVNYITAQKSAGPFNNLFATCSFDRTIKLWRKPTTRTPYCPPLCTLSGHENAVWSLAWGSNTSELFSASFDGTIRSWDVEMAVCSRELCANADRLLCMAIEKESVWTGSLTGHLIQWSNASSNTMTGRMQCITPCISALHKHNHLLYVGGVKHVEIWDDRSLHAPLTLLQGHNQAVMDITSFSECMVMSVSKDGTLKGWDATGLTSTPLMDVPVHKAAVRSIATCDDLVVTSSNDSTVSLWNVVGEKQNRSLQKLRDFAVHSKQVPSVDIDECHLYTASCDSTMTIHEYTIC
ncbi:hypothetical protein LEN26_004947 [Aphanomyces euteiches]|nr:hypothetical protein LEN26_020521 [Aphanomyces euteiches]KAH9105105.1 hypothetical protein LEN26_014868 [Aphanomyces euteiches]KAH9109025.1 hypothetical protein AeMF1_015823 [Aphanomyces euteiches]KAH9146600.1 hypothetical protein LEN26_004947 [Aphanomyces euteiches]KAH9182394.1 hypothetical protein AeNC1_015629 [Aphanomyces euteiches]